MWNFLLTQDLDFRGASGRTVPPGIPGAALATPVLCGRIARLWIRMPFHDCGTADPSNPTAAAKGGCNGSLRKEMPKVEPLFDNNGALVAADVFDVLLTPAQKAAIASEIAYDPARVENTGFAASVAFFYSMVFKAKDSYGLQASWADTMVYGGLLGVAICGGPKILFAPGRVDSKIADPPGKLPSPSASLSVILASYARAGLGPLDAVLVQSSHTCGCFQAGCLDTTPNRFDQAWAKETLAAATGPSPPICKLPGTFPADATAGVCLAPMDQQLLTDATTINALKLLAAPSTNTDQAGLSAAAQGVQPGYVTWWKADLCGAGSCGQQQAWGYFNLYATSYFRMCSLGLPSNWPGFAAVGTRPARMAAKAAAKIVSESAETEAVGAARGGLSVTQINNMLNWGNAYTFTSARP